MNNEEDKMESIEPIKTIGNAPDTLKDWEDQHKSLSKKLLEEYPMFRNQMIGESITLNNYGYKFSFLFQKSTSKLAVIATILAGKHSKCVAFLDGEKIRYKEYEDHVTAFSRLGLAFTKNTVNLVHKKWSEWDKKDLEMYQDFLYRIGDKNLYKAWLRNKESNVTKVDKSMRAPIIDDDEMEEIEQYLQENS